MSEQHVQQWIEEMHRSEPWLDPADERPTDEQEYAERWMWFRVGRGKNPYQFPQAISIEVRHAIEAKVDRLLKEEARCTRS